MAHLFWSVLFTIMITVSSVAYGFLTNAFDDTIKEDAEHDNLFEERERQAAARERALEKLQELLGLPDAGERRHHPIPPQFMTELYNNLADDSGISRGRNPFNAKVIRSFTERGNSMSQYYFFNISGLHMTENVLEAQLHLYRMKTPQHQLHPTLFSSPSIIIRVYQVLDDQQLSTPDTQRLLSSHMVGAHSYGWEVFNVKEAVREWVKGIRPNKGLLVTTNTLFENDVDVRFVRRNEHHNSKQPILVLFDNEGNPDYYEYHNGLRHSSEEPQFSRRRRSLQNSTSSNTVPPLNSTRAGNTSLSNNHTEPNGECSRRELYVDFEQIGWGNWVIAPKGYVAYYCRGHCNFPLGLSQRPTNHATVQSIVHELNLAPDVGKPCCVPTSLEDIPLLYYDDNDNVILKMYEDMAVDSCGCQ